MALTKKLRVQVDGKAFDVVVELPEQAQGSAAPSNMANAAASAPAPVVAAAPVSSSSGASQREGAIVSPLSGLVAAIGVKVGQDVKEGEHVLTLEAMKMNTFVFAPKNGKIKEIKIESGAAVQEGEVLMILE